MLEERQIESSVRDSKKGGGKKKPWEKSYPGRKRRKLHCSPLHRPMSSNAGLSVSRERVTAKLKSSLIPTTVDPPVLRWGKGRGQGQHASRLWSLTEKDHLRGASCVMSQSCHEHKGRGFFGEGSATDCQAGARGSPPSPRSPADYPAQPQPQRAFTCSLVSDNQACRSRR